MTDLINPSEMIMEVREVASAGRIFNPSVSDMGTLVDEGILTKEYVACPFHVDDIDIIWTNVSKNIIVENNYETIMPGESVTWEK